MKLINERSWFQNLKATFDVSWVARVRLSVSGNVCFYLNYYFRYRTIVTYSSLKIQFLSVLVDLHLDQEK